MSPTTCPSIGRFSATLDATTLATTPTPLPAGCWLELEIKEGKNRQIRRMVEALGLKVVALVRIRVGKLALGDLALGQVRPFKPETVV